MGIGSIPKTVFSEIDIRDYPETRFLTKVTIGNAPKRKFSKSRNRDFPEDEF